VQARTHYTTTLITLQFTPAELSVPFVTHILPSCHLTVPTHIFYT